MVKIYEREVKHLTLSPKLSPLYTRSYQKVLNKSFHREDIHVMHVINFLQFAYFQDIISIIFLIYKYIFS